MADLGTLAIGSIVYGPESGGTVGSDPLLEVIASADDTDYAYVNNNPAVSADVVARFDLGNMPSDFIGMTALSVRLRYLRATGTQRNTWDLKALVRKSDGTTDLTDTVTVASGITTTTATNSSVVNFTLNATGLAASKTDWDGAQLVIRWIVTRVSSGDTLQRRVTAGELTGTYSISVSGTAAGTATGSGSATGTRTVLGTAAGSATGSGSATGGPVKSGTAAGSATGSGSATGTVTVLGTAVGAGTGSGTATGTVTVSGAAAGAGTGSGSATGLRTVYGVAAGAAVGSGSATGSVEGDVTGTASGSATSSGTATGTVTVLGTAAGAGTGSGSATGTVTVFGTGTGAGTSTGTATGTVEGETPAVEQERFGGAPISARDLDRKMWEQQMERLLREDEELLCLV